MSVSLRGDCQASGQFIVRYWSVLKLVPWSHHHSITGLHSVHSPVLASSPRYHPFVKSVWIVGVSLVSRAVSARQIVSSPLVKSVLVSCPIHVCVSPPRFPPVSPHVAFFSCQSSHVLVRPSVAVVSLSAISPLALSRIICQVQFVGHDHALVFPLLCHGLPSSLSVCLDWYCRLVIVILAS
jgi:hypothetical protein